LVVIELATNIPMGWAKVGGRYSSYPTDFGGIEVPIGAMGGIQIFKLLMGFLSLPYTD
jgi:hypothetical protein